jgi:hypothetical protein
MASVRKLIWCVLLPCFGFLFASASGCGHALATSLCETACADFNRLKCGTCNCGACSLAPVAGDSYYECIQSYSGSCIELAIACPVPSQCQAFISENCT